VKDHHAILPTMTEKIFTLHLTDSHKKLYLLIIKRLLASLLPDCKLQILEIQAQNPLLIYKNAPIMFRTRVSTIKDAGWRLVYKKKNRYKYSERKRRKRKGRN